ncbi:hypothetical protein [Alteromonas stellipolaris]|jgi:hypothetical protein|uniref:hypothetical protein n=1 Tax=Alteromonas stellipolaris TaxID=233316 RepID=UPI001D2AA70B|nr:hypothetical protein [Alteromonas stellipolaris]MBZ2164157.1 hypothetical protein [Alteromonas stellipolaris]
MKQIALVFLLFFISNHVCANEPDELFGALTGLYWCMNKEVPTDLGQINKSLGFQLPPNANQTSYEKWRDRIKLVIESDGVSVVRQSDSEIVSSKVECDSLSISD